MKHLTLENRADIIAQIRSYLDGNSESKFIHRLQAILFFADREDETCINAGALFGNSPRSISNWVKRLNRTGSIESLRNRPISGRRPQLTREQKEAVGGVLSGTPKEQGIPGKAWNGETLSLYIKRQYGITLKVRACQLLLRGFGYCGSKPFRRDDSAIRG